MDHNLKALKQFFGNSKMNKKSPIRIMLILNFLNFSLFAHHQLTLPFFPSKSPECSYDPQKSYFFNGLRNVNNETQQVQWPLAPDLPEPRLTALSAVLKRETGPGKPHCDSTNSEAASHGPADLDIYQTSSSADQEWPRQSL